MEAAEGCFARSVEIDTDNPLYLLDHANALLALARHAGVHDGTGRVMPPNSRAIRVDPVLCLRRTTVCQTLVPAFPQRIVQRIAELS